MQAQKAYKAMPRPWNNWGRCVLAMPKMARVIFNARFQDLSIAKISRHTGRWHKQVMR